MRLTCPAKINLTLEVLRAREDGYHGVRSVMVPLAFGDTLMVESAPAFSFSCSDSSLAGDDNLVVRAAQAVDPEARVTITLDKRIPSQAGLGGGSSDAASVLLAAIDGAFGEIPTRDWVRTARSLGSDVPFFLVQTGALVEGTGERVTALGALPPWHVLLIKPPVAVSTAAAYAELDRYERAIRPRNASSSCTMLDALQRGDFAAVEATMMNDFHAVVAEHNAAIARALDALRAAGASNALLSGSGSAVFTLAPERAMIARVAERLDLDASYARIETTFAQAERWNRERV